MSNYEKNPPEVENHAQKLARKLRENKSSLHIGRIPKNVRETFVAIADEEFCSDYGMLLKALVDMYVNVDNRHIIEKLQNHEERLGELESNKTEDKSPKIKSLSGKTIQ